MRQKGESIEEGEAGRGGSKRPSPPTRARPGWNQEQPRCWRGSPEAAPGDRGRIPSRLQPGATVNGQLGPIALPLSRGRRARGSRGSVGARGCARDSRRVHPTTTTAATTTTILLLLLLLLHYYYHYHYYYYHYYYYYKTTRTSSYKTPSLRADCHCCGAPCGCARRALLCEATSASRRRAAARGGGARSQARRLQPQSASRRTILMFGSFCVCLFFWCCR